MSLEVGSMGRHPSRVALLATSSALALLVGLEQSAGACTVVTNPALPYTQSGDTCVHFTVSPATSGNVTSTGAVNAVGPGIPSLIGIFVDTGVSLNGSITNAGSITVGSGQGILVNQSTITGSIVNSTGALISSNGYGINVSGSSALPANATVGGSIVNNGTINSVNSGIQVQNAVAQGVTNTGSITASGPSGAAIALNQATIVGDVVNTGHLSAPSFSAALVIENGGVNGRLVEEFRHDRRRWRRHRNLPEQWYISDDHRLRRQRSYRKADGQPWDIARGVLLERATDGPRGRGQ